MTQPVRVAVNGACGRMGRALCALLAHDPRFVLAHAVVAAGATCVGAPVFADDRQALRYAADWRNAAALDVVIDFSTPAALGTVLDHCLAAKVSLVSGTTGCDAALESRLSAASAQIAVLRAANFSLGVAILTRLLRTAAAALPTWDVEILEAHHAAKLDAPSGTALALGCAAAQARDGVDATTFVAGREGISAARVPGSIGYAVLRGGDIVGEHTAMLIGTGERLELAHRATDRAIFARGALHAGFWLSQQRPGLWALDDALDP